MDKNAISLYKEVCSNVFADKINDALLCLVTLIATLKNLGIDDKQNSLSLKTEQLSRNLADDTYVQKQKQDVIELSSIYRNMLTGSGHDAGADYIDSFRAHFIPQEMMRVSYQFIIEGMAKPLYLGIDNEEIICHYGEVPDVDVEIRLTPEVMDDIVAGRSTFQKAFTMGDLSARGPIKVLRMLDDAIPFME